MSYYEALPIYRAAMALTVAVERVVQRLPKGHKYALGARLRDSSLDVVTLVARANRRAERARVLAELCDRVEDLKILLQVGKEVQAFGSFKQFAELMEQVVALARQAEGWRRASVAQSRSELTHERPTRAT